MPRQRASESARREQILDAAFRVAARERLDRLTVRLVAREAKLSSGLVFHYFKTKDALLLELLDWLLERTVIARTDEGVLSLPTPLERVLARLRKALESVQREREQLELFFDYWVLAKRSPELRSKLRTARVRYREVFRSLFDEMLRVDPGAYPGVTADRMAAVCVAFIEGCAVQAVTEPDLFDVESSMTCIEALISPAMAVV